MPSSYTSSAEFYDAIYTAIKNYQTEAEDIFHTVLAAGRTNNIRFQPANWLDVACGTGLHLSYIQFMLGYHRGIKGRVEGLDLSQNQLDIARGRLHAVPLHCADMRDFQLSRDFDVVTCLFSAIGYMRDFTELCAATANMAAHLNSGGVLLIEPWIFPEDWRDGEGHMQVIDTNDLKLVRMNRSSSQGNRAVLQMHYLVLRESDEEPEHFVERHILTMHSEEEYLRAMAAAGLNAWFEPNDYRGYFVGVKA